MQAAPAPPPARRSPTGWQIVSIVLGSLVALAALGMVLAGIVAGIAYLTVRDDDGYFVAPSERLSTPTPALTGEGLQLGDVDGGGDWVIDDIAADARIRVTARPGERIFVGLAHEDDVGRYLAGVAHDEVIDVTDGDVTYVRAPGLRRATPPGRERIWVASVEGTGTQTLDWDVRAGSWSAVVMNADGRAGVVADVRVGVRIPWLGWAALTLIVAGLVAGVGAGLLQWLGLRDAGGGRGVPPAPPPPPAPRRTSSPPAPPPLDRPELPEAARASS